MKFLRIGPAALFASVLALAACQSGYQTTQNRKAPAAPASTRPASQKPAKPPLSGDSYTVQAGDTLFGIAFRAGQNFRDVAAWNGIDEPYTIRIGQRLRLSPPANGISQKPPANGAPKKPQTVPPVPQTAQPATPKAPEPMLSNIAWQWPTQGEIIGRFVVDDKTRQGINIAGKPGQEIHAAADGVVVYSGTGLIGYGELLIVKHGNEWISAYAHNSKRLVAEGVKVKAGQHIADMGDTGSISTMLHFEIRRNGKPVDPLLYLPER